MSEGHRMLLLSDADREAMVDGHPVVIKEYMMLTPMIERGYNCVRDRVWMRRTGIFMYAPPQWGKTTCRNEIELFLKVEFPHTFIISFSAADGRRSKASASDILQDILDIEGIKQTTKRPSYKDLFFDLLTHIQVSTSSHIGRQFILLVDEMQLLSETDFKTLLVLHNRLKDAHISMTTIGFAQPEILHIRSVLKTAKAHQLIARFLAEPIPFIGCGAKEDLQAILTAYDLDLCYPENSDWTYTRFFLPKAYGEGFRLSDYYDVIWQALVRLCDPSVAATIPMVHVTGTVEYLLSASRRYDAANFSLSNELIDNAVDASGLANFYDVVETS